MVSAAGQAEAAVATTSATAVCGVGGVGDNSVGGPRGGPLAPPSTEAREGTGAASSAICRGAWAARSTEGTEAAVAFSSGPAGAAVAPEPLFSEGMGAAGASMGSAVCGSDAATQERRMPARCLRAGFSVA